MPKFLTSKDFWMGVAGGIALVAAIKRFVKPTTPVVGKLHDVVVKVVG